jgi:hypothetical protein
MSSTYDPTPYMPAKAHAPSRLSLWGAIRYSVIAVCTFALFHLSASWIAPDHPHSSTVRSAWSTSPHSSSSLEHIKTNSTGHEKGGFRRDSYPLRTLLAFWDLAEKEVSARGLDTCNDQLGRRFIDAYHDTDLAYCTPEGQTLGPLEVAAARQAGLESSTNLPSTLITCSAIQRHSFTKWWPYPAAPCISTNLRLVKGERKAFRAAGCEVTSTGATLDSEMGQEDFAGLRTTRLELGDPVAVCTETVNHTTILIGRQDQWNP